ncbi:MAG: YncE family protein [Bryobacteraceae bacterium]
MTRRSVLAGGVGSLGLFALACAAKKGTGYPGYILVAAAGDHAINAVDLNVFRLTHRIELNAAPSGVLTGSTPALAVAVTATNGTLHMIDTASLSKTGSIRIADDVARIQLLPDGKQAAAISRSGRQLIITDLAARKVVKRFRLSAVPQEVDVTGSDSKEIRVAVSFGDKGLVQQFNLTAGTSQQQQVSASVGALRYRKDGQLLFVANYDGRSITVLDGDRLEVVADLPVAMKPETLCFSADQGQLFVGGTGMDALAIVFVYQPLIVEQTVLAGQSPGAMATSSTPPFLFVASKTGPEINILSVTTRKVIAVVQAGPGTRQILITPDDQFALVLNEYSGDLAVIRIPIIEANRLRSGLINRTKSGASLLTMFPVGDQPVAAAITAMA